MIIKPVCCQLPASEGPSPACKCAGMPTTYLDNALQHFSVQHITEGTRQETLGGEGWAPAVNQSCGAPFCYQRYAPTPTPPHLQPPVAVLCACLKCVGGGGGGGVRCLQLSSPAAPLPATTAMPHPGHAPPRSRRQRPRLQGSGSGMQSEQQISRAVALLQRQTSCPGRRQGPPEAAPVAQIF